MPGLYAFFGAHRLLLLLFNWFSDLCCSGNLIHDCLTCRTCICLFFCAVTADRTCIGHNSFRRTGSRISFIFLTPIAVPDLGYNLNFRFGYRFIIHNLCCRFNGSLFDSDLVNTDSLASLIPTHMYYYITQFLR